MKIAIVLGTRPEIIKMSSVIHQCKKRKVDFFIIHTNQHYSTKLCEVFFQELNLPSPKYNLGIGSGAHGETTGKMIIAIEKVLIEEKPDIILVQGDTNSVLAGGIAASKLNIPIGHVEAGLRSYDRTMPEETNRIIVDHISKFLFTPTKNSSENLTKEGIAKKSISMVGNTIVDTLHSHIKIAEKKSTILNTLNLSPKEYILSTIHRQENVDDRQNLSNILIGLEKTVHALKIPILIPAHPRLIKMLDSFELKINDDRIRLINPLGYLDFLQLEKNARIVITDSGGVQEETCIIGTRCITIRNTTERPETISVGANILVGTNSNKILSAATMVFKNKKWKNPFGNGDSAKKIIDFLIKNI